jgi:hypothetical protein
MTVPLALSALAGLVVGSFLNVVAWRLPRHESLVRPGSHCPHCGARTDVFGHGGGRTEAARLDVPFLGEIPLDPAVRDAGDRGTPIVAADPSSPQAAAFVEIAAKLLVTLRVSPSDAPPGPGGIFSRFRRG